MCPEDGTAFAAEEAGELAGFGAGLGFGAALEFFEDEVVGLDIPEGGVEAGGGVDGGAFGAGDFDEAAVVVAFGDAEADDACIEGVGEEVADDAEPPAFAAGGGDVLLVEAFGDGGEGEAFDEEPVDDLVEDGGLVGDDLEDGVAVVEA